MTQHTAFAEALDAIDRLPAEDQEALLEIVRRRIAGRGRKRVSAEAAEAHAEFATGLPTGHRRRSYRWDPFVNRALV